MSGNFLLRCAPQLHLELKRMAKERDLSLNEFCLNTLQLSLNSNERIKTNASLPLIDGLVREYSRDGLVGIALFGSAARGELTESSDIDLLVVLRSPIDRALYRRWDIAVDIQEAIRKESNVVNPQFVRFPESADFLDSIGGIWLETAIEGRVIYDPELHLHRIFTRIRKAILAGKFERSMSHGHPYWIRKRVG
jgi:predicted nucleotidyltransferase